MFMHHVILHMDNILLLYTITVTLKLKNQGSVLALLSLLHHLLDIHSISISKIKNKQ